MDPLLPYELLTEVALQADGVTTAMIGYTCKELFRQIKQYMWTSHTVLSFCAVEGQLAIIKWLLKGNCVWTTNHCCNVISNGHIHILEWLMKFSYRQRKLYIIDYFYYYAAKVGRLDVLKWGKEKRLKYSSQDSTIVKAAIDGGHRNCTIWLYHNGFACTYAVVMPPSWGIPAIWDAEYKDSHHRDRECNESEYE